MQATDLRISGFKYGYMPTNNNGTCGYGEFTTWNQDTYAYVYRCTKNSMYLHFITCSTNESKDITPSIQTNRTMLMRNHENITSALSYHDIQQQ